MDISENYRVDANFRWLGSTLKSNEELCLTVCGIEHCKPDKFYGPTIRQDYHVHFVLRGTGYLEIQGTSYTLTRGQIFLIPPDVETYYYAEPSDPWSYTWISFAGTRAGFFLEKANLTVEHPVRDSYVKPEKFLELTEGILNHHELNIANELIRTSLLYEIIALLVDSQNQQAEKQPQKEIYDYSPDIYVNSALEYIHMHYNTVRVSDLADFIGISRYYLTHIFKEKLNTSPQKYILTYRLEKSHQLLCSTNLSIQEIADKVGYDNPLTFSKTFKSVYGLSPQHYRTKLQHTQKTPDLM